MTTFDLAETKTTYERKEDDPKNDDLKNEYGPSELRWSKNKETPKKYDGSKNEEND